MIETARSARSGESARRGAGDRAGRVRDDAARAGARVSAARQRRPAADRRCSRCTLSTIATAPSIAGDTAPPVAALTPAEAYLMTSLLEGVIQSGTGAAVRGARCTGAVAGKTGTTNDGRDAWFVGYTPRLLTVVWIGFDGGDTHGLSGADAALPMWADFMQQAIETAPPSGLRGAERHQLRPDRCQQRAHRQSLLPGRGPRDVPGRDRAARLRRARGHRRSDRDWWQRLRGLFGR